jgi:tetratricopeptide (TPR) repeat protein
MKLRQVGRIALLTAMILTASVAAIAQQVTCGDTDYDCQIKQYREQIRINPRDIEAYYSLASALQGKGDFASSIGYLDMYIASGVPKAEYMADAYNRRGFAQKKIGHHELAIQDFTKGIELFPKIYMYNNRGTSYASLKQYDPAIADHTKAIAMDPKFASAYFNRGYAYMGQKNNPPAIADFTKVIELDPAESEAFYNRGTIYYREKKYTLAIADLDQYIKMNTAEPSLMADGYLNRGLAYYYLGNTNKAIEDYTMAIGLAPALKNAYSNRAIAYRKLGKIALAEADEKKAAAL